MRWLAISALLHALALTAALAHWRSAGRGAEVSARIEMVFGSGGQATGGRASAPPSREAAAPAPPPAADPASSRPIAAPQATTAPVRLGDGVFGFDVPNPDADIVEAQVAIGNRPPPPPEAAFARGEHGRVVLRIHVRPDGRVGDIDTLQSSGFADLDRDAIDAARGWHFIPQLRDGQAVASVRDQAFDFVLR